MSPYEADDEENLSLSQTCQFQQSTFKTNSHHGHQHSKLHK